MDMEKPTTVKIKLCDKNEIKDGDKNKIMVEKATMREINELEDIIWDWVMKNGGRSQTNIDDGQ